MVTWPPIFALSVKGQSTSRTWYVKYKRTDALSLWYQQKSTTVDIHGSLQTRGETRYPGGVSDTTKVCIWWPDTVCEQTLYRKCHSHNTPEKGIITLESNPSQGTVLPAPHGKGNKCDKNVNYMWYLTFYENKVPIPSHNIQVHF